jgi:UDP-N-acetylmuramoylalanine-D-glutamate ligase
VALAWSELEPSESLLFSPACASFDEFLNFRDRALRFRDYVRAAYAPQPR